MSVQRTLKRLLEIVIKETETNPAFAERIAAILESPQTRASGEAIPKRTGRRAPGVLDPFTVFSQGEPALRQQLTTLTLDHLKDIVSEHGMDPSRLALKWRTKDRLVGLIVSTVRNRSGKGDAFRE
jgi:hypothetical protein